MSDRKRIEELESQVACLTQDAATHAADLRDENGTKLKKGDLVAVVWPFANATYVVTAIEGSSIYIRECDRGTEIGEQRRVDPANCVLWHRSR